MESSPPDPPPGLESQPKRLNISDENLAKIYSLAGTTRRWSVCVRCLEVRELEHRKNSAQKCSSRCRLCDKPKHVGAPCPHLQRYTNVFTEDWLKQHWPEACSGDGGRNAPRNKKGREAGRRSRSPRRSTPPREHGRAQNSHSNRRRDDSRDKRRRHGNDSRGNRRDDSRRTRREYSRDYRHRDDSLDSRDHRDESRHEKRRTGAHKSSVQEEPRNVTQLNQQLQKEAEAEKMDTVSSFQWNENYSGMANRMHLARLATKASTLPEDKMKDVQGASSPSKDNGQLARQLEEQKLETEKQKLETKKMELETVKQRTEYQLRIIELESTISSLQREIQTLKDQTGNASDGALNRPSVPHAP